MNNDQPVKRPKFGSEQYAAQMAACFLAFNEKRPFTYLCDQNVAVRWDLLPSIEKQGATQ